MNPSSMRLATLKTLIAIGFGATLFASLPALAEGEQPQMDLPRVELSAGMHRIDAQVAARPNETMTGLMYRDSMPAFEGMLFVFPEATTQCFWMRNTRIPLTAAFIADDGTIVNLADMKPMTENSHCSQKPVRFVLEMNQGWFAQKHIAAGFRLRGVPFKGN